MWIILVVTKCLDVCFFQLLIAALKEWVLYSKFYGQAPLLGIVRNEGIVLDT